MIEFSCPRCGEALSVPSCLEGKTEICGSCNHVVEVPSAGGSAASNGGDRARQASTFSINCPKCEGLVEVHVAMAGQKFRCPLCNRKFRIPKVETEPSEESASPADTYAGLGAAGVAAARYGEANKEALRRARSGDTAAGVPIARSPGDTGTYVGPSLSKTGEQQAVDGDEVGKTHAGLKIQASPRNVVSKVLEFYDTLEPRHVAGLEKQFTKLGGDPADLALLRALRVAMEAPEKRTFGHLAESWQLACEADEGGLLAGKKSRHYPQVSAFINRKYINRFNFLAHQIAERAKSSAEGQADDEAKAAEWMNAKSKIARGYERFSPPVPGLQHFYEQLKVYCDKQIRQLQPTG